MSALHALLLGIIEGFTEFLPISSTGHLILASILLRVPPTPFLASFEIAIQLGAILAVVALYGRSLLLDLSVWLRIIVAFIPTAIVGLVLYDVIKTFFFAGPALILWTLALGGIVLIAFEYLHDEKRARIHDVRRITYPQAVLIGLCQSIAVIPGVSRAAATIVGGMMLGVDRRTIVEFSFLLALPTMAAATGLDLIKSSASFTNNDVMLLGIGFVTSFLVALAAMRWLLQYVRTHSFTPFGIYRIAVAAALFFVLR